MTDALLTAASFVAILTLALVAYRRGARRRPTLLPTQVVEELTEHKLRCLGEPPERVELELGLLLGVTRRPLATRREDVRP